MKYLLFYFFLLIHLTSFADMVATNSKQYYGTITYIDLEKILLREGCGETVKAFSWSEGVSITFNSTCDHPGWTLSQSPATAEGNCQKRKVFQFLIKESQQVSYADEFVTKNHLLTIKYINNQGEQIVEFQAIEKYIDWIMYVDVCIDDIPYDPPKLE